MIAVLGDTTSAPALRHLHASMSSTEEGRLVLQEKPRITTRSQRRSALLSACPSL
jgi:hypothetical protein